MVSTSTISERDTASWNMVVLVVVLLLAVLRREKLICARRFPPHASAAHQGKQMLMTAVSASHAVAHCAWGSAPAVAVVVLGSGNEIAQAELEKAETGSRES